MYNYKLTIQYDGTNYFGWQVQRNKISVQQKIIDAIEIILKEKVNLIGSGRTDSGVHALGQVANFRYEKEIDINKFTYSLNSLLPEDIAIKKIEQVDENFHSRYDAKERKYIYLFSHIKSPFYLRYSYLYPPIRNIDINFLNVISSVFCGKIDFTSFCKAGSSVQNKFCEVREIKWFRKTDITLFAITADRFLHGMVRSIVGTLLKAAINNYSIEYLKKILEEKDRTAAGEALPAKGLFLYKVRYNDRFKK
ncbi:tRNA pseudouridine(38-40) synthase TruA [Melioribacter sp. OK-6-Me]|uniref:tRNA pseudouridine(38-40) synthase TruA n=1 Tax=unclassified Melioribacter TaxID=2627329 RepID=UPI003ED957AA